ncbi:hypothetical protein V6N11_028760 [Hibiscus sabdariffa]|uniref:Cytosolic Fe-S cluster assembly factor NBP35 n=1 Tax=Hibiscus sabdariffa TaxID=183260 RepID=A0ABR2PQT1_9ROSI
MPICSGWLLPSFNVVSRLVFFAGLEQRLLLLSLFNNFSLRTKPSAIENGEIPENANEDCPGPSSKAAGKSDDCQGCPNQEACATAPKGPDPGKGGVSKSTFSAQLSFALTAKDFQVSLLDIDICGPSSPKMLGLEGQDIHQSNRG